MLLARRVTVARRRLAADAVIPHGQPWSERLVCWIQTSLSLRDTIKPLGPSGWRKEPLQTAFLAEARTKFNGYKNRPSAAQQVGIFKEKS